jgi:hypothetical protein
VRALSTFVPPIYTLATRPAASTATGSVIYVSDATAGQRLQASDGTQWTSKISTAAYAAKGDLLFGSAANGVAKLGVGANGQSLVADSTQAAGAKWAAAPVVSLRRTANASGGAITAVVWDSEVIDTDGMHDPAVNPERATCVRAGIYFVQATIEWGGAANAFGRTMWIQKTVGGVASDLKVNRLRPDADSFSAQMLSASTYVQLAVGDYLTAGGFTDTAAVIQGGANKQTSLDAHWVRP